MLLTIVNFIGMNTSKILLFFSVVALFSCKKKKDEQYPNIQILKPVLQSQHSIFDYVPVAANVSDDKRLTFVKVDLLFENLQTAKNLLSFHPNKKDFSFDEFFHLDDIYLESGNYYVKVTASDGFNTRAAYQPILINGIPRELKNIFVLDSSSAVVNVSSVNSSSTQFEFAVSTDYMGAVFSDRYQYMAVGGNQTGPISFLDTAGVPLWTDPVFQNPPFPYFNHLSYDKKRSLTFISYSTGIVRGYLPSGTPNFGMVLPGQAQALASWGLDSYIAMQLKDYTQPRMFAMINASSATIQKSLALGFDLNGVFQKTENEFLLFGNENGQGEVRTYFFNTNSFTQPLTIPPGEIFDVCQISSTEYMVAHTDGLYRYTTNTGSFTPVVTGVAMPDIGYDDLNDLMVCATGNEVRLYTRFGLLSSTITHGAPVVKVLLNYNK